MSRSGSGAQRAANGRLENSRLPVSGSIARMAFLRMIVTDSGCEEVADRLRDLGGVRFQREVPRVEKADDRTRDVPLERLRARRQEERVVLAPHREQRGPVGAEIFVKLRVQR